MQFDSNLAWRQASEAVNANREVLFALAGVFVLLPNFAFSLLFPQPEPPAGLPPEQTLDFLSSYYGPALPWLLGVLALQAVGSLALMTLFTDRSRPTVGQAIRLGFTALPSYIAAHILIGIGMGFVGGVLLSIAGITGSKALVGLAFAALAAILATTVIRTSLTTPAIAVEGLRNPVAALRRSWQLTQGNGWRLFGFYLLIAVAFVVVMAVIMLVVGTLLAVVLGTGGTAKAIAAFVSTALSTVVTVYFVGIVAAVHRQLSGGEATIPGPVGF